MGRDALAVVPEAAPGTGTPEPPASRGCVPGAAFAPVPPLLPRPGRLGARDVPAADGDRLARPAADRIGCLTRPGARGRRPALADPGPVGRLDRRPGGSAQAPDRYAGCLRPARGAALGERRGRL